MEGSSPADATVRGRGAPRVSAAKPCVEEEQRLRYRSILTAVDCSDHSNRGVSEAVALAGLADARVTGIHVYAARLHDMRFRQMEGGLPERYRQQEVLEQQRDIHNELIARGLTLIADSYLEEAARACREASIPFAPCTVEGKNYRGLLTEANSGRHDLLVIGARGLGATAGGRLGTVCERVVRRSAIDTLVIKDPKRALAEGPIAVAVDGSPRSYGGLLTALGLARHWNVPVEVLAAYDSSFHYVAFNRINAVLSREARAVFRFEEQKRLHEEIIDSGLARIYEGHLTVARAVAEERGAAIETRLLDGKPCDVIAKHLRHTKPTLLILGKLGIHADAELDIGGTAESLLREVDSAVLFSQRTYQPRADLMAEATTVWTPQAEERLARVPEFVRPMARLAILRFAQERAHTVITADLVTETMSHVCPHARDKAPGERPRGASADGEACATVNAAATVLPAPGPPPQSQPEPASSEHAAAEAVSPALPWTAAALRRLARVPDDFLRQLARGRIEAYARSQGAPRVTVGLMQEKYAEWAAGSAKVRRELRWEKAAWEIARHIPAYVRGTVIKEVERCARTRNATVVTREIFTLARAAWKRHGSFHSQPHPGLYTE